MAEIPESDFEVHKFVNYHTNVETMQDAMVFVMKYMDEVGPDPEIEIGPVFCGCGEGCDRTFFVSVRGRVPLEEK